MLQEPFTVQVAYFSMEIALEPDIPTYAGGLGILAGDSLRSAADHDLPVAAVTLVHHKGYFRQRLDAAGNQTEEPDRWKPADAAELIKTRVTVTVEDRPVRICAWRYLLVGIQGQRVPVYLLDSSLPENDPFDQTLTDSLYLGDDRYRLCQEVVLGRGGVKLLEELGYDQISNFHMNEGHSALLALELLRQQLLRNGGSSDAALDVVRRRCIFTTHTPVPAGHDNFEGGLVRQVLGSEDTELLHSTRCCTDHSLNMTYLALRCSHYINGVGMHHGEVSRGMYPRYPIRAITNGVHAITFTSPPFQALFDRHIPEWRHDNHYLRYAVGIPLEEFPAAHQTAKAELLEHVEKASGIRLDHTVLTVGFARRATTYKRADLFFHNIEKLRWIVSHVGPIQVVMAGKAHPFDDGGKEMIRSVFRAAEELKDCLKVVYLEDYDMRWGMRMTAGVDVWLNTPKRPQEASGTSGMKAALNGVPSLSVLDGWWMEGHMEGITGWSIGEEGDAAGDENAEASSLYDKLERAILPLYYGRPREFARVMRWTVALNGSFFNTQRMIRQYADNAYFPEGSSIPDGSEPPVSR